MRIAVTGASGFIGSAVATALADADHEVVGFGRRADGWSPGMWIIQGGAPNWMAPRCPSTVRMACFARFAFRRAIISSPSRLTRFAS